MTTDDKSQLLELIGQGEVQLALDQLLSLDISASRRKEALTIAARFHKLKQQNRLGILSFEQSNLTESQITAHLIDLINYSDDRHFPVNKSINATNPSKPAIWKYVIATAVIIGILGSLAEILNFFSILPTPAKGKPQLSIFVTDTEGNVVLEHQGELNTSIGNRPMRETIGSNGRANFGDILPEYLGNTIVVGFKAEGWEIADGKNTFVFSGNPIQIRIKKDDSLGIIKGMVKTRDGQGVISGATVLINNDTTAITNELGIYKIILPEKMRVKEASQHYELTVSKKGYKTEPIYYLPNSNREIRLEKL